MKVIAVALAILAFFLFVGSPFEQAASALVLVDDALIAVIIAALTAIGITFTTTGQFSSLNELVGNLMGEYASDNDTTISSQLNGVQTGSNALGQLLVNHRFVVYIQGFAAWLKVKFGLTNNMQVDIQKVGSSVGGLTCYSLPIQIINNAATSAYRYEIVTGTGVYGIANIWGDNHVYYRFYWFSDFPSSVKRIQYTSDGHVYESDPRELTYSDVYGRYFKIDTSSYAVENYDVFNNLDVYTAEEILAAIGNPIINNTLGTGIITGNISLPYDNSDYQDGDGAVIDINAPWGSSYGDIVNDVIPDAFSDSGVADAAIDYVSEQEVVEQVEDTPAESQPISQDIADYQVLGLQSVFPFCIPFDIYSFFECLAAEPVAPSFTWRFYVPGICDETIVLDLSDFDSVAQIVRTMELLAFIVGLAFVTREKMIKG